MVFRFKYYKGVFTSQEVITGVAIQELRTKMFYGDETVKVSNMCRRFEEHVMNEIISSRLSLATGIF